MSDEGEGDYIDEEMEHEQGLGSTERVYAIDKILSQDGDDSNLLDRYTNLPDAETAYAIAEQKLVNKIIDRIIKRKPITMALFDEYNRDVERLLISVGARGRGDVKAILGAFVEQRKGRARSVISQFFGSGASEPRVVESEE